MTGHVDKYDPSVWKNAKDHDLGKAIAALRKEKRAMEVVSVNPLLTFPKKVARIDRVAARPRNFVCGSPQPPSRRYVHLPGMTRPAERTLVHAGRIFHRDPLVFAEWMGGLVSCARGCDATHRVATCS